MFYRKIQPELLEWARQPDRKPLILRGARQVGKTTAVNIFSQNFEQYIYLNLENPSNRNLFLQADGDIHVLAQSIFVEKNAIWATREKTLLFIDEIQQVPAAVNMLRYFYEEYPEIRVIAAGSLLETILDEKSAIPVGRVDYRVMRTVSFPEFVEAMDQTAALEQLKITPVRGYAHSTLLRLFQTFALIGGMPEIVDSYVKAKDLTRLPPIYERLINAYIDDIDKYGKKKDLVRVMRYCIRTSFKEAGKRIKFANFGRSDYSSREVGEALRTLEKAYLLSLIYPTVSTVLPIEPDERISPRLQVLDTGMMNYFLGIQLDILNTPDLNQVHRGVIIEHLVGQEILASQFNVLSRLDFWTREKRSSMAEIDYVYPFEGQLIPIEVKAGKSGTLKSLHLFMDLAPHDMAIRFNSEALQLTEATTPAGKSYYLLSLPYYLASQTKEYISWLKGEGRRYVNSLKKAAAQRIPPTSPETPTTPDY
jgi:predicted AAA+ superfamily ATPase